MAQLLFRKLFQRSPTLPMAANDSLWDAGSDPETLTLQITDYDLHERDLGPDTAAALQKLVLARLQAELSKNETLTERAHGSFELLIHNAAEVDIEKLADHLQDAVLGEAFTLNRALLECELETA
ncbi:MAG: hypothetical protein AB8B93_03680 [Pseudomonadales bacterium]